MKTLIFFALVCSSFLSAKAASIPNGHISGTIQEVNSGHALQFAKVVLLDAETNKQVGNAQSMYSGYFEFSDLPAGEYLIRIYSNGFEEVTLDSLQLVTADADFYVGNIQLSANTKNNPLQSLPTK